MRRLSGDEGKEVTYSRGKDRGYGDIILDDTARKTAGYWRNKVYRPRYTQGYQ